jgi:hypothetical protein
VINFAQTAPANRRSTRHPVRHEGVKMSETNQFRQYAEEALGWVAQATTEKEKRTLIELACTWAQAAAESQRPVAVNCRAS